MRDDDDDDYGDGPPGFPLGVRIAGIAWIVIGVLSIAGLILNVALAGVRGGTGGICGGLIGIAFLVVGFQTVNGTAKDTLGNGIGSLVLGLLQFGLMVVVVFLGFAAPGGGGGGPGLANLMTIVSIVIGVQGAVLCTAGLLAIVGRPHYRAWREYHVPDARPRRRRRRDDDDEDYDDDEDDRPRRRRKRRDDD